MFSFCCLLDMLFKHTSTEFYISCRNSQIALSSYIMIGPLSGLYTACPMQAVKSVSDAMTGELGLRSGSSNVSEEATRWAGGRAVWLYSLAATDGRTYKTEGGSFWSDWSGWTETKDRKQSEDGSALAAQAGKKGGRELRTRWGNSRKEVTPGNLGKSVALEKEVWSGRDRKRRDQNRSLAVGLSISAKCDFLNPHWKQQQAHDCAFVCVCVCALPGEQKHCWGDWWGGGQKSPSDQQTAAAVASQPPVFRVLRVKSDTHDWQRHIKHGPVIRLKSFP